MIALPAGTNIWIAAGVTDLRRGFTGLSAVAQTVLEQDPYSGHVFVFRGRRGDLIKLLWWDGDGLTGRRANDFEVSGTHIGLVFNPIVYDLVARRLAGGRCEP